MLLCALCLQAQRQLFFNLTAEEVRIGETLPVFVHTMDLGKNYGDSTYTVSIKYPEFITMSNEDAKRCKELCEHEPPELPVIVTEQVVDRKCGVMHIMFSPVVVREGKWMKMVSFMLNIEAKANITANAQNVETRATAVASRYAEHSVLASGKWAKIRVPESGIYQLTDALIKKAGFSNLNKVKVYGYGGALQPERLTGSYLTETDDLKEVPTCVVNGRRLFHAQGPVSWNTYYPQRTRNPYSDYGYYFLTENDAEALTVDSAAFVSSFYPSGDYNHVIREVDNYAWFEGGRNLFEDDPLEEGQSRTYTFNAPGPPSEGWDEDACLYVSVSTNKATTLSVEMNGSPMGTMSLSLYDSSYDTGTMAGGNFYVDSFKDVNTVKITNTGGNIIRPDYIVAMTGTYRPVENLSTDQFAEPEYVYNITNQDLHADQGYQMVIIIPASQIFLQQAERLKDFHEKHDGLKTRIVPADELYNEFSSGTPDANAYRRYMKMLYDKAENDSEMPRYLLLFGDCAWDNRMNTRSWKNYQPDDFLLCYESENSFNKVNCYVDENYFCYLDDGEGGNPQRSDRADVAVGRFPARTVAEAKIMVDKTISYVENKNAGPWQNTVMVMGDDGNGNVHMNDAISAANLVTEGNPAIYVKRVMWDAYNRTSSSTGNTYPDVTALVKQQQANGALIMDYCGHGSAVSLSHERVLGLADFENFVNTNLPLWITASCDIMPFDGQTDNIGETAIFNSKGGAVAFFGTTRTVYTNYNMLINTQYLKALFERNSSGKFNSIGEAQRLAKNRILSSTLIGYDKDGNPKYSYDHTVNKLQYSLLGDPALILNIPTLQAVIDDINGQSVNDAEALPELKAGSIATVRGHIERNGIKDSNFKGTVNATVRDAKETITCQLNDTSIDGATKAFQYEDRTKVLFNGSSSVSNGEFTFSFAIPKDINYSGESGLINIYAQTEDLSESANGCSDHFLVGGSALAANDSIGPSVFCYLNSPDFVDGGDVNTTPYFVAEITDKDGLNTTGNGIGHDLELVIDGEMSRTYNLNNHFRYDFGSYTQGTTYYSIPALSTGKHKLKFRAWDILNNSTTTELTFNVVRSLKPGSLDVNVTQNPARTSTTFIVNHDRIGSPVDVEIEIYDISGRRLWKIENTGVVTDGAFTTEWDLTTGNGKLQTGVYLYRVQLGCDGSSKVSKAKKLVIINE
jgi:hypothetical protein